MSNTSTFISATVYIVCKYCGTREQVLISNNNEIATVVCDNETCGANYDIKVTVKESE